VDTFEDIKNELVIHFHHLLKEPEGDIEVAIKKVK
jgi:hypothetical protein